MEGGGDDDEVKVLGEWSSPFAMRPQIALNLKGVKYELVEENLRAKSRLLVESNPIYKKVPVLLHRGRSICESMIIVEYVDAFWGAQGSPIVPMDPYDRAMARFWAYFVDDQLFRSMMGVAKAESEEQRASYNEQMLAATHKLEEAFKKCSKGGGFFGGDTIGYLDIALGSHLGWLKAAPELGGVNALDKERTPLLAGWVDRFCAEEAIKGVMLETARFVEFGKDLQAKWKIASGNT